uniref:Uncharacterized protein n=1 Tax=Panthera tigris altaica TaxID=74533 RepID=A0A8C9J531_PANTA
MHGHQESRRGHKDQLESPESDVRDGEIVIVAHIFAPRLQSVADEIGLLISPHFLRGYDKDHNAENEEDGEPDFPDTGGVFVDAPQNGLQRAPIHLLRAVCAGKGKANTTQG